MSPLHNLQRRLVLLHWPFRTHSGWHRGNWRAQSPRLKWARRFRGAHTRSADDHTELRWRSKQRQPLKLTCCGADSCPRAGNRNSCGLGVLNLFASNATGQAWNPLVQMQGPSLTVPDAKPWLAVGCAMHSDSLQGLGDLSNQCA